MNNKGLWLVNLNVNGMATRAHLFAQKYLYNPFMSPPDVFCLQDTCITPDMEANVLNTLQYDLMFIYQVDCVRGLIIGFNRAIDYMVNDHTALVTDGGQALVANCAIQNVEVTLVDIYISATSEVKDREKFYDIIHSD